MSRLLEFHAPHQTLRLIWMKPACFSDSKPPGKSMLPQKKTPAGLPPEPCTTEYRGKRLVAGSGNLDVHCIHAFFATLGFKRDRIALADFVNQTADVDEDFLPGGSVNNEPKAFGLIKELDSSCEHCTEEFKEWKRCIWPKPPQR